MIKKILLGLLILAFMLLTVATIVPKSYTISRSVTVDRTVHPVYEYLRHLNNEYLFNMWLLDKSVEMTYSGVDGEVGSVLYFKGNKSVGEGKDILKGLEPDKRIDITLQMTKPYNMKLNTPFDLRPGTNDSTIVTWSVHGKMPYPMNIVLLFVSMDQLMAKTVVKNLELSLNRLRYNIHNMRE